MSKVFIATVAAGVLTFGSAFAQVSRTETTTTVQEPTLMSPDTTVQKSEKSKTYNADGSISKSSKNITRSGGGVSAQSKSETVAPDGSSMKREHEHNVNPDGSTSSSTTTQVER